MSAKSLMTESASDQGNATFEYVSREEIFLLSLSGESYKQSSLRILKVIHCVYLAHCIFIHTPLNFKHISGNTYSILRLFHSFWLHNHAVLPKLRSCGDLGCLLLNPAITHMLLLRSRPHLLPPKGGQLGKSADTPCQPLKPPWGHHDQVFAVGFMPSLSSLLFFLQAADRTWSVLALLIFLTMHHPPFYQCKRHFHSDQLRVCLQPTSPDIKRRGNLFPQP